MKLHHRLAALLGAGTLMGGVLAASTASAGAAPARAGAAPAARSGQASGTADCPWLDASQPVATRVQELMSAMTVGQKVAEMHAFNTTSTGPNAGYEGYIPAQPSLCIPALNEQDDSAGVGAGATGVTQLPSPQAAASTWDPSVMRQYGDVIGSEMWGKGIDFGLSPTINIVRDPRWGRAFETLGEDPYLTAKLGVPDIEGIQSNHVLADVKHYTAYNQETYRNTPSDDVVVSNRTLHEIYLPGWHAATMQAKAASVMCSYSSPNGTYSCQNPGLLTGVLDQRWGYPGYVRSDGGANHSTAASVNAGLDQEKGSDYWGDGQLQAAVENGQVSMATINEAVRRILTQMFTLGLFDHPPTGSLSDTVTTPAHAAFARTTAEQGTVLLKNANSILPLNSSVNSIAVIGADGGSGALTSGGGSAHVNAPYVVTPYQGISARAGSGVNVTYSEGAPASGTLQTAPSQTFTVPETGTYQFSVASQGPAQLTVASKTVINPHSPHSQGTGPTTKSGTIQLTKGQRVPVKASYRTPDGTKSGGSATLSWRVQVSSSQAASMRQAAAQAAGASQVAIVFASNYESEGADLPNITLQNNQDQLIESVAQQNPNTIVVLNTGSAVTMPWLNQVQGVLEGWYPGQEDGNAIAAVLFGDVDPGGHLTVTFPQDLSQAPASTPAQWTGTGGQVDYSEGLDAGYRWYDAKNLTPAFPFGYGLSYTHFSFSNLQVTSLSSHGGPPGQVTNPSSSPGPTSCQCNGQSTPMVKVTAQVTNTGSVAGSDVAQLYLGDPAAAGEPPRQLRGFQRVALQPGQSTTVSFTMTGHDLSYWDDAANGWVLPDGSYQVHVGDSSALADLPLQGSFSVTKSLGALYASAQTPSTALAPGSTVPVSATFTNHGDYQLTQAAFALPAPAGWTVNSTSSGLPKVIAPGQSVKASWSVTVPEDAQGTKATLVPQLTYQPSGESSSGKVEVPTYLSVEPVARATAAPVPAVVSPGKSAPVTVTITNNLARALSVQYQAQAAGGISGTPASGSVTVPAQGQSQVTLNVSAAQGTPNGSYELPVSLSASGQGQTYTLPPLTAEITVPYDSLAAAFNNVGITDPDTRGTGNLNSVQDSFDAAGLTAAGLAPGATITRHGFTFTWPDVPPGQADNVQAAGQTIAIPPGTQQVALLATSVNAASTAQASYFYPDGTTQPINLTVDYWRTTQATGSNEFLTNTPTYRGANPLGSGSLFYIPLPAPNASPAALILPSNANIHIFAMGIG